MARFVRDEILLPKLPVFLKSGSSLTEDQLDKLVDLIEEELILKKAEEIKEKRANETKG